MKRKLAIISIFSLALMLVLTTSVFLMTRYLDPNKYKGRMSQYVYAKTGQVLVINGSMEWSFFPWIGLKANNLTYYNSPEFTPKTFISAKEMDIKVKLLPLLRGKIEVGSVIFDHATLNLIKETNGKYNWETLTKSKQTENKNAEPSYAANNLSITSLKIINSKLNWYDSIKQTHTTLDDLDIDSKNLQLGHPFPLSIDFTLIDKKGVKDLSLELKSDISISKDAKSYDLENLKIVTNYFLAKQKLAIKASGKLNIDLSQHHLKTNLDLASEGLNAKLNLSGDFSPHLNLDGQLSTNQFDLKELLSALGSEMHTKNNKSLRRVLVDSNIAITDQSINLSKLHAKIDSSDIYGAFKTIPGKKSYQINLVTNQINIDDFIPAKDEDNQEESGTSNNKKDQPWNLNGSFKVGKLIANKISLSNLNGSISATPGLIKISPITATFYQGSLAGTIVVDKRNSANTNILIKQTANNVDVKELLHQFSESDKLSGRTDLSVDLVSNVNKQHSFLEGLNGKIRLSLHQGSLRGMDVIYQLSRAHAFIKHLSTHGLSDSKETAFSAVTSTGTVVNGVINMDDLLLTSDYLKVNGKGSTNLVTTEIKYHLNALAQPRLAAENNQIGKEITIYQVPIKVSGKLSKPSVNLDFAELAKLFIAKEIQKPISDHIGKNINKLKNNLKDKVEEKIKSFSPVSLLNKLTTKNGSDKEPAPVEDANARNNDDISDSTTAQ